MTACPGERRHSSLLVMAVVATCGSAFAQEHSIETRMIDPSRLARVGVIDERFQSYNVEMAEIIGGNFWKPYGPGGTVAAPSTGLGDKVAGQDPNLYQKLAPLDTANPRLRRLAAALAPAYVRISGTWANSVYFHDADSPPPASAPAGFNGVLTRSQWKGALDFARAAKADLVSSFAISTGVRDRDGVWTADQAARWLDYTRAVGGRIAAAEFFNEPTMPAAGGAPKGYDGVAYARDFAAFTEFAKHAVPEMALVGPGAVGEATILHPGSLPDMITTEDLLRAQPRPIFDIYSYHHYGAASIRCASMGDATQTTAAQALSEQWLARPDRSNDFYVGLRDRYEAGKPVWITEIADAACGGNPWAATFLDSFRYADSLGRLARQGVAALFQNTLASSEYGLLAPGTFIPRPNYWAALLWRRLMGTTVLDAGKSREGLHLYAHCLRGVPGGVALLAINNTEQATTSLAINRESQRYTLSAARLQSTDVKLNGSLLKLAVNDDLPTMAGHHERAGTVRFAPATITFIAIPSADNDQCKTGS